MPKAKTVEDHLHQMRDELVELAGKCNEARHFDDAHKVQGAILIIDALSDTEEFDRIAWPPRIDVESDGFSFRSLVRIPDTE